MYTLILADGTKIENLALNGDSFVSAERIDEAVFQGNLSTLTITHDGETEVRRNVEYTGQLEGPDGWYFSFADIPSQEVVNRNMNELLDSMASILSIMMGVSNDE